MMKFRSALPAAMRFGIIGILLLPAMGCPRKKIIFHLDPPSMTFTAQQDASSPPDQILTMTGIKHIPDQGAPFVVVTDQPWLNVQPLSGTIHSNEPIQLTVSADSSFIPEGTYPGTVLIIAYVGKHRFPQTYDVTLVITPGNTPPPIVLPPEPDDVK